MSPMIWSTRLAGWRESGPLQTEGRRAQVRAVIVAVLGLCFLLAAAVALARPTEEEIARLGGPELTPFGAQRAGNAEGTIPEWTGGITESPAGWKPRDPRVDLFADDKVLFTIDASNVDQYADKLSPGQIALIKTYEGYKMDIYPTRRSCTFPPDYGEVAKSNARVASVDDDCLLTNGIRTPLFPIPETGCEAIQNAKLSIMGGVRGVYRHEGALVPTKGGAFEPSVRTSLTLLRAAYPEFTTFASLDRIWTKSITHNLEPAKQAGELTLVHVQTDGHFKAWTYNPGQRRVRRTPNFEYDNLVPTWQGLVTLDQLNGYAGAADRYDWKLIGKQELYVPYNPQKFFDPSVKYADMIQPRYPRRDLLRYELHRVWVVEATVRPDRRHTMPRRVFYIDEDSWLILVVDGYDTRGSLWRVSEHLPQVFYELSSCLANSSIYYDLVAGRYVVSPVFNEGPEADYLEGHKGLVEDRGFLPDDLRRLGRR